MSGDPNPVHSYYEPAPGYAPPVPTRPAVEDRSVYPDYADTLNRPMEQVSLQQTEEHGPPLPTRPIYQEEHGPVLPPRHPYEANQFPQPIGSEDGIYNPPPPPQYNPAASTQPYHQVHHLTTAPGPGAPSSIPPPPFPYDPSLPPPKRRKSLDFSDSDDPNSPIHYIRDPHKLIAYLVPFPRPSNIPPGADFPARFLIYTPPPPPIPPPKEGEKDSRMLRLQRKWQHEVREAKQSDAKINSWKGVKSRATKGINTAMGWTTTSSLDFLNRVPPDSQKGKKENAPERIDGASGGLAPPIDGSIDPDAVDDKSRPVTPEPHSPSGASKAKTPGLEEMVLIYPPSMPGTQTEIRTEFVNSMLRTKSKAQRDAIIATGLLPVSFGIDVLLTLVWPFGGLLEIDAVWGYSSFKGAKTARSVTKRLKESGHQDSTTTTAAAPASAPVSMPGDAPAAAPVAADGAITPYHPPAPSTTTNTAITPAATPANAKAEPSIKLTFTPSPRLLVLERYLASECHRRAPSLFASPGVAPTETRVLEAVGWSPSSSSHGGAEGEVLRNWEDEQWELQEVKDDLKKTMHKGAGEWEKWCKAFGKDPVKAGRK